MNASRQPGSQIERLRVFARVLDEAVRVPGTNIRFGLDALLGLLPGAGDVAGGVFSAYTILMASRLGAPRSVLARMAGNVLIDALVGAVPVLGDLFDVGWKANRRNVQLLEGYVDQPASTRKSSRAFVAVLLLVLALMLLGVILGVAWVIRMIIATAS